MWFLHAQCYGACCNIPTLLSDSINSCHINWDEDSPAAPWSVRCSAGQRVNHSRVAEVLAGVKLGLGGLRSGVCLSRGRSPTRQLGALFLEARGSGEAEPSPAHPC